MKLSKKEAEILAETVLWPAKNGKQYYSAKDDMVVRAVSALVSMNYLEARFDSDGDLMVWPTKRGRVRIMNPRKLVP